MRDEPPTTHRVLQLLNNMRVWEEAEAQGVYWRGGTCGGRERMQPSACEHLEEYCPLGRVLETADVLEHRTARRLHQQVPCEPVDWRLARVGQKAPRWQQDPLQGRQHIKQRLKAI